MKVEEIIKQVRYSIDEEAGQSDYMSAYMDNIIKAKIGDALRWVCLYADATLLSGKDESGCVASKTVAPDQDGYIEMGGNFLRLIRVRASGWHKAVMKTITEDSDEYLMQYDDGVSKADASRPVAALIETSPNKIQIFPTAITAEITYAVSPDVTDTSTSTDVSIPSKAKSAFVYYLAYLVMIAYDDSRASVMLATAKMHAGITQS